MATVRKRTWMNSKGRQTAWIADYKDQNGERHIETFKRMKEAEAWLAKTQVDVAAGTHTPDYNAVTVIEAVDLWLRDCDGHIVPAGMYNRRNRVKNHIRPSPIANVKLSQLTAAGARGYYDWLLAKTSIRMANEVFCELRAALALAHSNDLVKQNVAASIKLKKARPKEKKLVGRDLPEKEEVTLLLQTAPDWWRALFIVAVFTGMRSGELRALTWGDVDFRKKVINVRRGADAWGRIGLPKSRAGVREIQMTPMVFNTLQQHAAAAAFRLPPMLPNFRNANFEHAMVAKAAREAGTVPTKPAPHFAERWVQRHLDRLEELAEDEDWEAIRNYTWVRQFTSPERMAKAFEPRPKDAHWNLINRYKTDLLAAHEYAASGKVVAFTGPNPADLVFPNAAGKIREPRSLNDTLKAVQVKAGIVDTAGKAKYTMHKLRHFFASWAIDARFRPDQVKAMIGHANISTTYDIYGHLFPSNEEDQKKLAEAEAALFATSRDKSRP
jgi:integrase